MSSARFTGAGEAGPEVRETTRKEEGAGVPMGWEVADARGAADSITGTAAAASTRCAASVSERGVAEKPSGGAEALADGALFISDDVGAAVGACKGIRLLDNDPFPIGVRERAAGGVPPCGSRNELGGAEESVK